MIMVMTVMGSLALLWCCTWCAHMIKWRAANCFDIDQSEYACSTFRFWASGAISITHWRWCTENDCFIAERWAKEMKASCNWDANSVTKQAVSVFSNSNNIPGILQQLRTKTLQVLVLQISFEPTVPEGEREFPKFNYSETFEQPPLSLLWYLWFR